MSQDSLTPDEPALEESEHTLGAEDTVAAEPTGDSGGSVASGLASAEPDRVAHFLVIERIGAGGMGVVYAAYDPQLDRRVALKLVRSASGGEAAKVRLLREAQGMARIAHPNVVSVFEAGTHAGAVWLAMELVEGGTLGDWLAKTSRSWRAILACFIETGRGLAAAHAAGLIHRDFKPDNVLIGDDERPRVADFGLVRPAVFADPVDATPDVAGASAADAGDDALADPSSIKGAATFEGSGGLGESVTRIGAVLGTPRYMAPEQIVGEGVGPHSDQFSFCVALYRALFDQAPFSGDTVMELVANVLDAKLRSPPRDTTVPRPIVDAVMRGLSHDPEDRFATIDELLEAITPAPPRRWGLLGLASLTLALAVGALAVALGARGGARADLCGEGPERLVGVWDSEVREQVERGFDGLELAYGSESLELSASALDTWAEEWIEQYTDACEATHVRGDQSGAALDLRMACLDRQRRAAGPIVDLLVAPDAETVEHAAEIVAGLPDPAACARLEELRAITPPSPAQAEQVADLRDQLARVWALHSSERKLDAQRALASLETAAATLDYAPVLAELTFAQALLDDDRDRASEGGARAFALALQVGDEALALNIASNMIALDGSRPEANRRLVGERWFTIADGLAERRGRPLELELTRLNSHAWLLFHDSKIDAAVAEARRAVSLAERGFGSDTLNAAGAYESLAKLLSNAGRYAEAMALYQRANQIYASALGPNHPRLLRLLHARGMLANQIGEPERGRADLLRMIELSERVRGPDDLLTLRGLSSLGISYDMSGEQARARAVFEDLLERLGEREAPRGRLALETANSLCFVLHKLGEDDEARAVCKAALVGARERNEPIAGILLNNLGLIARAQGQLEVALAHDREALVLVEASLGPGHNATSYSLIGIGESLLMLGQADEALEPLERALSLREAVEIPGELAEARCLLARALLESSGDRSRARALLETSARGFAAAGHDWDERARACASL